MRRSFAAAVGRKNPVIDAASFRPDVRVLPMGAGSLQHTGRFTGKVNKVPGTRVPFPVRSLHDLKPVRNLKAETCSLELGNMWPKSMIKAHNILADMFLEGIKDSQKNPAIVCDADGTLIHSLHVQSKAFIDAWEEILGRDYPYKANPGEVLHTLELIMKEKRHHHLTNAQVVELIAAYEKKLAEDRYPQGVTFMRGADVAINIFHALRQMGIISRFVVGSFMWQAPLRDALEKLEVLDKFDGVIGSTENLEESKDKQAFVHRLFPNGVPTRSIVIGDGRTTDANLAKNITALGGAMAISEYIRYGRPSPNEKKHFQEKEENAWIRGWHQNKEECNGMPCSSNPNKGGVVVLVSAVITAFKKALKLEVITKEQYNFQKTLLKEVVPENIYDNAKQMAHAVARINTECVPQMGRG